MAESSSNSSLGLWRDMIGQWEKGINALANETMASDQFSGSVNGAMNLTLKMQQALAETMATYLTALNLPSKADVVAISERLASIESRLDRLVTVAERATNLPAAAREDAVPMPPRTRKPPEPRAS